MFWRCAVFHSKWLTSWIYKPESCNSSQRTVIKCKISWVYLCLTMCSWCSLDLFTSVCWQKPAPCLVLGVQRQLKKSMDYHIAWRVEGLLMLQTWADILMAATLILSLTRSLVLLKCWVEKITASIWFHTHKDAQSSLNSRCPPCVLYQKMFKNHIAVKLQTTFKV